MTTESPVKMTHRQVLEALTGLLLGMFVSMIATTVVSTSMPVIVHDLGGDQAAYTWVITATLLTTAISTPIWGKLADLFNRKLLIQLAIVIFVGATAAAGFAQDTNTLIAFRAIQGIGGGGLAALSQVIMADIISPRERGRYMGLFGAVMAVATVGGPLLGGWITDVANWRWNFFVALPFAIAALIILQKTLHISTARTRKASIDYTGIVLLSAAVSLILIWITNAGSTFDWWSTETVLMVGGSIIAAVAFIIVENKVREPLIPLSLFKGRTFTLSVIASISIGVAMFGTSVYLAQYMQLSRGASPTEAGLMTLPMMAGLLLSSMIVGQLVTRFGKWKGYLILGSVLLIAGSTLLSTLHYDTNFALVSLYMFFTGAGVGMTMQNLVLIVQNVAKPSEMGVGQLRRHVLPQPRRHGRRLRHGRRAGELPDDPVRRRQGAHRHSDRATGRQGCRSRSAALERHAPRGASAPGAGALDHRGLLRAGDLARVPHRHPAGRHQPDRDPVPAEQAADHDDDERAGPRRRHEDGCRRRRCRRRRSRCRDRGRDRALGCDDRNGHGGLRTLQRPERR